MNHFLLGLAVLFAACAASPPAAAQPAPLVIKPLVEKKVAQIPAGPLFWRLENFPAIDQARAAAGPHSLAAEAAGKAWLFTLGAPGGSTPGGTKVVEVGPLPPVTANEFLLRVNEASGAPGSITPPHTHPGSEAFYVLAGETTSHSPHGATRVPAGTSMPGHGADMPMRVLSSGATDLHSLVMFVVDANRPFSSPAKFP